MEPQKDVMNRTGIRGSFYAQVPPRDRRSREYVEAATMKVFISWSGPLSKAIANAMNEWLPLVIQQIEPFFSEEDIDKGTRWSQELSRELATTAIVLFCVTQENLDSRWLNFEAGAISKILDNGRVMPFLFGLKKSEVQFPLAEFQLTIYDRDDIWRLVSSINRSCVPQCVDENRLQKSFDRWWPDLEESLKLLENKIEITKPVEQPSRPRSHDEILEEILYLIRDQNKIINSQDIRMVVAPDKRRFSTISKELMIRNLGALRSMIQYVDDSLRTSDSFQGSEPYTDITNAAGIYNELVESAGIREAPLLLHWDKDEYDAPGRMDEVPF